MTPEQKSAFIVAQTQMMMAEREVMTAENIERQRHGKAPANGPDEWEAFRLKWEPVLGYNALISFFSDVVDWPNEKLTDGGPASTDCNQKPNPPFGAASC